MNKTILLGRLCGDPELKFAAGAGTAITKFTLAVDGFKKGDTDFIHCIAFNKTAETIANYLVKGSQMALEGHIKTGSYDDKDGKKVYTTDVIVDRFDFCGSKSEGTTSKPKAHDLTPAEDISDSEIPF